MTHRQAIAYAFLLILNSRAKLSTWDGIRGPVYPGLTINLFHEQIGTDIARTAYLRLCDQAEGKR